MRRWNVNPYDNWGRKKPEPVGVAMKALPATLPDDTVVWCKFTPLEFARIEFLKWLTMQGKMGGESN